MSLLLKLERIRQVNEISIFLTFNYTKNELTGEFRKLLKINGILKRAIYNLSLKLYGFNFSSRVK